MPPSTAANGRGAVGPAQQIVKLTVDQQHNVLNVPLDSAPTDVQLDPNIWVPMMQATFVRR